MHRYAPIFLLSLIASASMAAAAPGDEGALLTADRWREHAFGVSLLQPAGYELVEHPDSESLVMFIAPDGTTIRVSIRQGQADFELDTLKQNTIKEMTAALGESLVIDDLEVKPGGRPGTITYFPHLDSNSRKFVIGVGLVKLDPRTVVVIQLRTPVLVYDRNRAVFEAMIGSIDFADPQELNRIRTAWIRAGKRWHDGIDRDHLKQAMQTEQWLRIVHPQKGDVGYARIRHRLDTMMGEPGIHVEIGSRIVIGADSYDTESFFFESDNAALELWSVRTAKRSLKPDQPRLPSNTRPAGPTVVTETGIRSGGKITVKLERPGASDNLEWPAPPEGYLSQVELQLLPALLPRHRQHEFAFYAYNSSDRSITLRTMQIYPTQGGGYVVRQRPAPDRGEEITTYNAAGHLVRRQMPDGLIMLPATADQMRAIWDIQ